MHNFSFTAVELLRGYKNILKKQLSTQEYAKKIAHLNLRKKLPSHEKDLYYLLEQIAYKNENELGEEEINKTSRSHYSGRIRFLKHIKETLASHTIHGDKVVNHAQISSQFMIEAVQLMKLLTDNKDDKELQKQLDLCSLQIAKYGNKEQQASFWEYLLKTQTEQNGEIFIPVIEKYKKYLNM